MQGNAAVSFACNPAKYSTAVDLCLGIMTLGVAMKLNKMFCY